MNDSRLCRAGLWPATILVALSAISAAQTRVESLRANLTYLASDELEGRGTPSKGLDLAADFIAQQFRQAGLQPASPDGTYFQVAKFGDVSHPGDDFSLTFTAGRRNLTIDKDEAGVRSLARNLWPTSARAGSNQLGRKVNLPRSSKAVAPLASDGLRQTNNRNGRTD